MLDAGGFNDLAQVAQRRLQLSAHSFARPIVFVFLPLLAAAVVLVAGAVAVAAVPAVAAVVVVGVSVALIWSS